MGMFSGQLFFSIVLLVSTVSVVAAEDAPITPCSTKNKRVGEVALSTPPRKKRKLVSPPALRKESFRRMLIDGKVYVGVGRGKALADGLIAALSDNSTTSHDQKAILTYCVLKDISVGKTEVLEASDGQSTLGAIDRFLDCNVLQGEEEWATLSNAEQADKLRVLSEKAKALTHTGDGVST